MSTTLTPVVTLGLPSDKSETVQALLTEIAAMRRVLQEIITTANVENRAIEPYELYELAAMPLTVIERPRPEDHCSRCGHLARYALEMNHYSFLRPTAICACPPEMLFICAAVSRVGKSITRCTNGATQQHLTSSQLVCDEHPDGDLPSSPVVNYSINGMMIPC